MIRTSQIRQSAIAAVFGVMVSAAAVFAQEPQANAESKKIARSDALQRDAQCLFETPEHWQDAAAMLTQAARLRPAGDPEKQRMLATAARLYAYKGNSSYAIYWMQRGAEQALAGGDVITAAHTFTQAAVLASEQGDWSKVKQLAQRVQTLASSPLLTDEQREGILRPFAPVTIASTGH